MSEEICKIEYHRLYSFRLLEFARASARTCALRSLIKRQKRYWPRVDNIMLG